MPEMKIGHAESWVITLARGEHDDWPDRPVRYSRTGLVYRPGTVKATLTRGQPRPSVSISGPILTASGKPGKRTHRESFFDSPPPRWAADAIRAARQAGWLTPGKTGVDW